MSTASTAWIGDEFRKKDRVIITQEFHQKDHEGVSRTYVVGTKGFIKRFKNKGTENLAAVIDISDDELPNPCVSQADMHNYFEKLG